MENVKHEEYQYLELIKNILENGSDEQTRNGITKVLFGCNMRFSLRDGKIPILTTKKTAWKTCLKELLWFIRGSTDNDELKVQNVHIWDKNASPEFLKTRNLDYEEGELGPIYGFQWRHFGADYINSATAPQSVTQDTIVSVEVSYQASTYRDIVVVFQLNSSPWTTFGYNRIPVSAGSSTLNIPIAIDANTPIASGIYKFVVYIVPTSGGWNDRLDAKTPQNMVSCIQAPSSVSNYDSSP